MGWGRPGAGGKGNQVLWGVMIQWGSTLGVATRSVKTDKYSRAAGAGKRSLVKRGRRAGTGKGEGSGRRTVAGHRMTVDTRACNQ